SVSAQMIQRHLADATRRLVDDAEKRQIVARIDHEAKVSKNVTIFLTLEEGQSADNLMGHTLLDERRFQSARQGVDAEKDSEIAVGALAGFDTGADAPRDPLRFFQAGIERKHRHWLARRIVRDQMHRLALMVMRD